MSVVDLEKPAAKTPLHFDSEEAFEAWCNEDTRAVFLDGEVIMHSPAGAYHQRKIAWLTTLLELFIDQNQIGELFSSNLQIRLSISKRRLADLTFVSQDRLNIVHPTYIDGAPDLIIEFVSEESTVRDWSDISEYQAAGVKEYWVIDQRLERMDLYILDDAGKYNFAEEQSGKLFSKVLPGFWLKPEWLWQKPLPSTIVIAREIGVI